MSKLRDGSIDSYLYTHSRGADSPPRFYGDFRDFQNVGGGQEALVPPGSNLS